MSMLVTGAQSPLSITQAGPKPCYAFFAHAGRTGPAIDFTD